MSTVATFTAVPIPMNKPGLRSPRGAALQVTRQGLLLRGDERIRRRVHLGGGPEQEVAVASAIEVRDAQRGDAAALVALWRELATGAGHPSRLPAAPSPAAVEVA